MDGILTGWSAARRIKTAAKKADATPTQMEAVAASMRLSRRKALAGLVGVPFVGGFRSGGDQEAWF